jgi:acetate kinase
MRVLVVNAGSSSLKLRVLGPNNETVFSRDLPAFGENSDQRALSDVLTEIPKTDAVGHRIVHGGRRFSEGTLVDDTFESELRSLIELAPLHQPLSLAALNAVSTVFPEVPAVACFDTAFHATLRPEAATYAVPVEWRDQYGVRRYGFHGLSHAYATRRSAELLQTPMKELKIVTCHLGAGASLAAVRAGVSVDTTMGFTPLEGLVMATRSGTVDPGLVLWLQQHAGLSVAELADALEHRSGLKGLAGTPDMREVLAAAGAGEPDARLAVDVYVHRLCASVAAMAASMGGLDVLVFTGGVGENAWPIRQQAATRLRFLDVALDQDRNRTTTTDADISAPNAEVRTLVVSAREDIEIAREVRRVLGS